jgi:pyridoxamine 5'-phosphate oxidase
MEYDFDHPPTTPFEWCREWFAQATEIDLPNPLAMALSTVDSQGRPSSRIVLLKDFDDRGAVFFTNSTSQKGSEIAGNKAVALLFHWDQQCRQIRITGNAERISDKESDAYFQTRPRGSQISAWASTQSQPAESRQALKDAWKEAEDKFCEKPVPRPPYWFGYRVSLDRIEFWQGQDYRYHDRVRFEQHDQVWSVQRLYP